MNQIHAWITKQIIGLARPIVADIADQIHVEVTVRITLDGQDLNTCAGANPATRHDTATAPSSAEPNSPANATSTRSRRQPKRRPQQRNEW